MTSQADNSLFRRCGGSDPRIKKVVNNEKKLLTTLKKESIIKIDRRGKELERVKGE